MTSQKPKTSWVAFALFYVVMIVVLAIMDITKGLLQIEYVLVQLGLLTVGVAIFALVGWRNPDVKPEHGVLLAFTVGVLTIVPAILISWGLEAGFWTQYFLIAFGMAAASILSFGFVHLARRLGDRNHKAEDKET